MCEEYFCFDYQFETVVVLVDVFIFIEMVFCFMGKEVHLTKFEYTDFGILIIIFQITPN